MVFPVDGVAATTLSLRSETAAGTTEGKSTRGNRANAPGQAAKGLIAEAGLTDAPANLQGKVTSALARGLPVDGLLAVQQDPAPTQAPGDGTGETGETDGTDGVVTGGTDTTPPAGDGSILAAADSGAGAASLLDAFIENSADEDPLAG